MKRTYRKEFKTKACELVLKDGIKHAIVAEKMGIKKIMLYQRIDGYEIHCKIMKIHCRTSRCAG